MQSSVISEKNVQLMCDSPFVVKLYVPWITVELRESRVNMNETDKSPKKTQISMVQSANLGRSWQFTRVVPVLMEVFVELVLSGNFQLRSTSPPAAGTGSGG